MQLCIVMRIRGSLGAFIHCIIENGPFTSSWAVVPTAKHQLWDLGASPDQLQPGSSVRTSTSPVQPSWRLLTTLEGSLEGPALASAGWIQHHDSHPPAPDHHTRTEVVYRVREEVPSRYSLAFSVRANCPAINHDRAVTAASAPMCRKGAVACRTQE